ncbi:hypothetical protein QBA57_19460 [Streptomyces scabiei]|uniref:hypothetical protein n=2 Tax=Streptomyces scabiei TaxID=1930 RepID=UPI0007658166|nr:MULTISPECIES: hypothetical protein [Streptomyces]MBP5862493.1 hypothetical protein [Streptomyces sp. LBUM 1484]MBP5868557.1 hypothetical protein [Streptomyces sp. LBUM 1485]MBP5877091.1 hypothetical protein [Streptomyces sp. LBUM 1477]MBP5884878.1 hypothetical protein [Streptomyces sp. LBUM 1487]MBP5892333.1 hypothetical protein [Streptomyces sp. LBUM 1481]
MRRPYRVLARVVVLGMLAGAAGCFVDDPGHPRGFPEAAVDDTASPSPSAPSAPALTDARARSALLRQGDLGDTWAGTKGAATWRDGLLKGRTDRPECQELLDAVYAEDVLGKPRGGTAVAGFDDFEYGAQLRYQVGAYDRADVDARLGHLRQLIDECGKFTITGSQGREHGAEVAPVDLPGDLGDARQGLRLVVSGDVEGEDSALTFDLATVRVGDTAALVTHGGLYGIDDTATRDAALAGAKRLRDVLEKERQGATKGGKTPKKDPKKDPKKTGEASPGTSPEDDRTTTRPSEEETTEEDTSEQDTSEEQSPDGTSADEDDYSDEAGRPARVTGPPPSPRSATA